MRNYSNRQSAMNAWMEANQLYARRQAELNVLAASKPINKPKPVQEKQKMRFDRPVAAGNIVGCCATTGFYRFMYDSTFADSARRCGIKTKEEVIEQYQEFLDKFFKEVNQNSKWEQIFIVTLNSKQTMAARALENIGFIRTPYGKRRKADGDQTATAVFVKNMYEEIEDIHGLAEDSMVITESKYMAAVGWKL